ncbi:type II toxin-antitoxin system HipA family toxin [Metapseudomonas otitidis]|uniref:type II toxin-antitoxin system HipA family toxin n=1 Tax=Metapseudomonas otitidis TaxID=319939 RepID=UPI0013F66A47
MVKTAKVVLWDMLVGALLWDEANEVALFEYDPDFVATGLEIAPIHMPLQAGKVYEFRGLNRDVFKRLPPAFADSLPDDYGSALFDAWLAREGRDKKSVTPLERLLYSGVRGMGALEYSPAYSPPGKEGGEIQIDSLVKLAGEVLAERESLADRIASGNSPDDDEALQRLIQIGTSAGGARAKAVIAINDKGEIRSGQIKAPPGYTYWLFKFDVEKESRRLEDSQGFGRIEYAYHLMAVAAGTHMMECRLHEEGGRAHFMTKRFDRTDAGEKIHMQTLGALDHADFTRPGQYSYEEAFAVMRELSLPAEDAEQLYRRMAFNAVARNHDDHVKNISFLMDQTGEWRLSPAYDVAWSYKPGSEWVETHQMTINGKRDGFIREDLTNILGKVRRFNPEEVLDEIAAVVRDWPKYAAAAGVPEETMKMIAETHRLYLGESVY